MGVNQGEGRGCEGSISGWQECRGAEGQQEVRGCQGHWGTAGGSGCRGIRGLAGVLVPEGV